jgi:penicillin-binding protein 1B
MKLPRRKRLFLYAGGVAAGLFLLVSGIVVIVAERKIARLVPGGLGESFSTRVYGAPTVLTEARPRSLSDIFLRLGRVNYKATEQDPPPPGAYLWRDPVLTIGLRGFHTPALSQNARVARLTRGTQWHWTITDGDGNALAQAALEPEMIAELSGAEKVRREPARWEEFPPHLIDAVLVVEDKRFFVHHGIDPRGVARALWVNLGRGKSVQGGSTITQQLVKNLFLTQKRTLRRKAAEAFLAVYLDLRKSKEDILTLYLNEIYLGQEGATSIAGMRAAARFYFDKDLADIDLPESALLAGIIRSPYRYNPLQNPEAARQRRNQVLKSMAEDGKISDADLAAARVGPVPRQAAQKSAPGADSDYFTAEVVRQLVGRYGEDAVFRWGLRIDTTADPLIQSRAQKAAARARYQAAAVVLEADSGRVLALVGGKNFAASPFNRATQARRQPGSSFKPFVYGAALEENFTPATILQDAPRVYLRGDPPQKWAPKNYDGVFHGTTTLRQALALSMNGATLDLAEKTGLRPIINFARKAGIQSELEESLAMVLGASEVSPLEIIFAYAPFANGGFRVDPILVASVADAEGNVLELNAPQRFAVLDPKLAYIMTSLLQSVVSDGTGRSLAKLGWTWPAAAKTGTTNDGRDAWLIGYADNVLTGVWSGDDDAKPIQASGAVNALPIWAEIMTAIFADAPPAPFAEPQGIVKKRIDPLSGLLARAGCPNQKEELFAEGLAPADFCPLHAGGVKGWLQRLFSGGKK